MPSIGTSAISASNFMDTTMIEENIENAAKVIREGGVVAFPTETLYGLAVDPMNSQALKRLLAIKGRDAAKGIPVIAASYEVVQSHFMVPASFGPALREIWPAALSVALKPGNTVPELLCGDFDSVAVRVSALGAAR